MNAIHSQKAYNPSTHPNSQFQRPQFYSPSRNVNNPNQNNQSQNSNSRMFYSPNQTGRSSNSNFQNNVNNMKNPQFYNNSSTQQSSRNSFREVGYKFGEPIRSKENEGNRQMIFQNNPKSGFSSPLPVPLKKSDLLIPDAVRGSLFKDYVTENEKIDRTMWSNQGGILTNRPESASNSLRDSKYKNFGVPASYHQK